MQSTDGMAAPGPCNPAMDLGSSCIGVQVKVRTEEQGAQSRVQKLRDSADDQTVIALVRDSEKHHLQHCCELMRAVHVHVASQTAPTSDIGGVAARLCNASICRTVRRPIATWWGPQAIDTVM